MKKGEVIVEQRYNAPVPKVWEAITDRDQMKEWYFDLAAFKPEAGFEFQFYGKDKEGHSYLHLCKVTEVIKEKKLTYTWRYDGFEGNSFVTFELFDETGNTKLRLTHTGLDSLPSVAAFAEENFLEGWTYLVQKGLKEFVEK